MKFTVSTHPDFPHPKLIELEVDVLGVPLLFSHIISTAQYLRDPKAAILWTKTYLANAAGSTLTQKIKEII